MVANGYKSINSNSVTYKPKTVISSSKKNYLKAAKHFKSEKRRAQGDQLSPELTKLARELSQVQSDKTKEILLEKFFEQNPNKKFFRVGLTKSGLDTDVRILNMAMIPIKRNLYFCDIVNDGYSDYVVGGLGFFSEKKMEKLDSKVFDVEEIDFNDRGLRDEFVEAFKTVE